jgi:sigma-B regulation protein RsbU (phosphoserine phosphatase)
MQAAMTVMRFSEILRYETHGQIAPETILTNLNRSVSGHLERRLYITACIGMLDVGERSLTVASAGHPPVYYRLGRTGEVVEVGTSGFPLGVVPDAEYRSVQVGLESRDVLVFYTDGTYEAHTSDGELYGFERLAEVIQTVGGAGDAHEVLDRILGDVEHFTGAPQQEDDMTMVVVKIGDIPPSEV